MSWQARLEIYKKGFLDEVDAILGGQEDKEYRLRLAEEVESMAREMLMETSRRANKCWHDLTRSEDELVSESD